MDAYFRVTMLLVSIELVLVAAGLVVRGRAALCWSFQAYVVAVLVVDTLIMVWPERFLDFAFYQ